MKKICDKCKQPATLKKYDGYGDPMLCPECYAAMEEWISEMEESDSIAEQRAERYNEEVLAGMHAPDDYGDYIDRIMMLYDPMFDD